MVSDSALSCDDRTGERKVGIYGKNALFLRPLHYGHRTSHNQNLGSRAFEQEVNRRSSINGRSVARDSDEEITTPHPGIDSGRVYDIKSCTYFLRVRNFTGY